MNKSLCQQLISNFKAFFLANEYLRAQGLPGLADEGRIGKAYEDLRLLAERHISVAKGDLDVEGLAKED
jgi:hypothetical protein